MSRLVLPALVVLWVAMVLGAYYWPAERPGLNAPTNLQVTWTG
jgi:hypothetical protein